MEVGYELHLLFHRNGNSLQISEDIAGKLADAKVAKIAE